MEELINFCKLSGSCCRSWMQQTTFYPCILDHQQDVQKADDGLQRNVMGENEGWHEKHD